MRRPRSTPIPCRAALRLMAARVDLTADEIALAFNVGRKRAEKIVENGIRRGLISFSRLRTCIVRGFSHRRLAAYTVTPAGRRHAR